MIRLENVHKVFANGHAALAGVDLEVARGEVFGIIGRSGAGKSTLVRLLNGLERPTAGQVEIDGIALDGLSGDGLRMLRRRVGMIFQNFGLLGARTIFENVALPLRIAGADRARIAVRVPELLARVGLADHGAKYPAQLSGGQKQRVGIARALAMEPKVLLMDEPFGALDALTRARLQDELLKIVARTQSTVVMVTHDVDEAVLLSDRIVMMTNGPAATIGEILDVGIPRPRVRVELAEDARYVAARKQVIDFLYTRHAHVEQAA